MLKKAWKIVLAVVLALLVVVLGYVAYVFIDYHRIGNQELTVERNAAATVEAGKEYGILSYNIGFGAYEDDYSFFMDGGTESRAWSEERLTANIERIGAFLQQQDADLYLLQEVDRDSTRSYHVDEAAMLTAQLPGLGHIWAQNYDSPYLFYPLDQPHGKSVSGLLTLSSFGITEARRVELPIEAGVMKLVDLDRCYSVHRIPAADGRELVLYNVHLSAYTSDGTIAVEQLELLRTDMQAEYEKGNWCIAGGDFNKDLLGQSEEIFGGSAGGDLGRHQSVAGGSAGRDGPRPQLPQRRRSVSRGTVRADGGRLRGVGQRHRGAGCGGGHGLCVVGSQSGVHAFCAELSERGRASAPSPLGGGRHISGNENFPENYCN